MLATLGAVGFAAVSLAANTGTLLPTSDGSYKQWGSSFGTNHYSQVNEVACNGTTNFIYSTTVGQRESFYVDLSSVPNGATITQIGIAPCASRNSGSGSGSAYIQLFYQINSLLSGNFGSYSLPQTNRPTNLATTTASMFNTVKTPSTTLQIGVVYASGNKGVRLSRLAAQLTYDLPATVPSAPTDTIATKVVATSTSVTVQWTDTSSDETGFIVERSVDGAAYTQVDSVGQNITTSVDKAPAANAQNCYRVKAYNTAGDSGYSNVSCVSTVVLVAPSAPINASATKIVFGTSTFVQINWVDTADNETGFMVERSADGGAFAQIKQVGQNSTTTMDYNPVVNAQNCYRVKAYNAAGDSGYSNTACVSTVPTPAAPSDLQAYPYSASSTSLISLFWTDDSNNETEFHLEKSLNAVDFSEVFVAQADFTGYNDFDVVPGLQYYYRVRAYNAGGFSPYSNMVSTTAL